MASVLLTASALLIGLLAIPAVFDSYFAYEMSLFLIYGIAAQGIGFLWGKTGILPLGQALFFGVGAYLTAAILGQDIGIFPTILASLVMIFGLAGVAFVLAAMIFRGRADSGPYFSLITLALVMIAEQLAATSPALTGGFNGFSGFDSFAGLDPFESLYYLIAVVTALVSLSLLWLNKLPANLVARAVFDNEPRLQLLGFPTHIVKGMAFGLGAALAGLAGWLFASHQGIVTPTSTGFAFSAELVILAAVGGRFHVLGPLLGAVVIGLASSQLRDSFPYWELTLALLFIAVVLKAPGGLAAIIEGIWLHLLPRKPAKKDAPDLPAPQRLTPQGQTALSFKDVRLKIGSVKILNGITVTFPETGIVSIIGPNGAGKTSALNTITGNLSITGGDLYLGTKPIANRLPHRAFGDGIGRKLQVPSVFFSMTLRENIALATMAGRAKLRDYFSPKPLYWSSDSLRIILSHPRVPLAQQMDQVVGTLPQGHRQFLEFAMTAAARPEVLLLDEPCAGLSPDETAVMTDLVEKFQSHAQNLVIMIEHDMSIVEAISQKVLVLHQGEVLAFDSYTAVRANKDVQAVYAGGTK